MRAEQEVRGVDHGVGREGLRLAEAMQREVPFDIPRRGSARIYLQCDHTMSRFKDNLDKFNSRSSERNESVGTVLENHQIILNKNRAVLTNRHPQMSL